MAAVNESAPSSARALDGDEVLAGATATSAARRHGAGDLVALDLAEGQRSAVLARTAIGAGDRRSAGCAGRETAVDPVVVGVVGDDENALLGVSKRGAREQRKSNRGEQRSHVDHSLFRGPG